MGRQRLAGNSKGHRRKLIFQLKSSSYHHIWWYKGEIIKVAFFYDSKMMSHIVASYLERTNKWAVRLAHYFCRWKVTKISKNQKHHQLLQEVYYNWYNSVCIRTVHSEFHIFIMKFSNIDPLKVSLRDLFVMHYIIACRSITVMIEFEFHIRGQTLK